MGERTDPLDQMLDDALASYGKTPPNEELEHRILLRVRTASDGGWPFWRSALASAGALAFAIACVFWYVNTYSLSQTKSPIRTAVAAQPLETPPGPQIAAPARSLAFPVPVRTERAKSHSRAPKLSHFPASSPMSDEERALARLVSGDAKFIPAELTHSGEPVKPIEIASLEVKPLAQ